MADHYEVLQVSKEDPYEVVKASYHRLALLNHPDKTSREGAAEVFRQVNEAWSVLGDAVSRAEYDRVISEEEQVGANAESVLLSEFGHADDVYRKTCRCGNTYEITEQDLKEGYRLVQCSGCSLILRIVPTRGA